jgi:hypothetical protein
MPVDPTKVHVWQVGNLYVFDADVAFEAVTHVPADIDTALHAAWLHAGLVLGDPGFGIARDIEETDLNGWQLKRFRTTFKNGKADGMVTFLEENDVVEDLLDPTKVPEAKARYLAYEVIDSDTGFVRRRFTTRPANLFVENDDHTEEVNGRPCRVRFYPDANKDIFVNLEGIPE